ncbi:coiled-coil domain-containing protein 85C [Aphidius gifuensis]|uniref:coiled-coil domain-containing protein 85C n=1 Tax=Aphidius gifuensis TaxID=684658 RepID=UPI001CDD6A93|nr:coiled-coil domain-containing protein 85C [Aphidius gifuensis]
MSNKSRYQPPPHPTIGILKNHPNFCTTTIPQNSGVPSSSSSTGLINQQQVSHPSHLIQQQQQQSRLLHSKDAQGKFTTKIEHLIPQSTKNSTTGFYTGKSSGQYLPPNSQYPTSTTVTNTTNKQRLSDEEFLRLGPVEMLKFVRKTETDIARLAAEQNRQIQSLLNELRILKEANQRLSDDNQELRDLCCFLDDDRQKGRKLAREWQRFGRYTASVMRQEVSAYQNKLHEERGGGSSNGNNGGSGSGGGQRDDGDGSSSSTNAEENLPSRARHAAAAAAAATFNDQTMQYVRSLEQRVKQLEEDKSMLQARAQTWELPPGEIWDNPTTQNDNQQLGGRPEAVVRALQVLEVREQLERDAGHDNEKALVREMCNVVWRKLEETSQTRR